MREPHYTDDRVTLYHGDCLDVLRELPDASVDAVVTDPPYALNFMGKKWDNFTSYEATETFGACEECGDDDPAEGFRYCTDCMTKLDEYALRGAGMIGHRSPNWNDKATLSRGYADNNNAAFGAWCELWAVECLRVLKPGGHLLAFGGTRTWHRLACAIEDAGFDVRDSIAWMYGSGFPKSHDVSKAIDKAAGAQREVVGGYKGASNIGKGSTNSYITTESGTATDVNITAPATDAARQWQGWGTALKPAFEPIVVARKPLVGTVAANVLAHGTGALNIDACRIGTGEVIPTTTNNNIRGGNFANGGNDRQRDTVYSQNSAGRWPANVILDESQAAALDRQSGVTTSPVSVVRGPDRNPSSFGLRDTAETADCYGDTGGASRFFYTSKASTAERPRADGIAHPTVKPLDLMRYLVRLVTPPGGVVLEPFAGSGTTAEACVVEGFDCIAIEREADYLRLIVQRLSKPIEQTLGF